MTLELVNTWCSSVVALRTGSVLWQVDFGRRIGRGTLVTLLRRSAPASSILVLADRRAQAAPDAVVDRGDSAARFHERTFPADKHSRLTGQEPVSRIDSNLLISETNAGAQATEEYRMGKLFHRCSQIGRRNLAQMGWQAWLVLAWMTVIVWRDVAAS